MAVGNTFGATALSSYGGFWIGTAIILTPGGFDIISDLTAGGDVLPFYNSFGLYLMVSSEIDEENRCLVILTSMLRAGSFSPPSS
jgi:succinate-acetate transporter protein